MQACLAQRQAYQSHASHLSSDWGGRMSNPVLGRCDKMTKEELVVELRDPSTKGNRGTIVWLLQEHDCSNILDDLVTCVIDGSYEEVTHATDIIENTITEAFFGPDGEPFLNKLRGRFRTAITEGRVGGWRREAVNDCLRVLEGDALPCR